MFLLKFGGVKFDKLSEFPLCTLMPDCVITDYRLRDHKTGIDAILAIHSEFDNAIPALIITGDIEAERLREVNDSGFQVLHKPVAPMKLRAFLHNLQLR